ncbi:SIR2 family protein [Chitinophaga horti]|uniref:SIR2 family protein n=1 Tax=Chitinophaga horti TaxID=2920382 RepID=A0ABY6J559_9BACT|nr:SIR2 family protein [Chitinophaga horti]UYQ94818.1 SIR2 family protein [Chitinophaga horti]
MKPISLLVGNDINNATQQLSWATLLDRIIQFCCVGEVERHKDKPFPLLYEEIFLSALRKSHLDELKLKTFIAEQVTAITSNEIHERIRGMRIPHIMTTNYEYSLEGAVPKRNTGLVRERIYSVFRRSQHEDTTYWHVHGECRSPQSINLGYEHYGGQLQQMRNYVVSGTDYKTKGILKDSLEYRLQHGKVNYQSWIDLWFTTDVHIFGLSLDFSETDLWWLLTYRARLKYYKQLPIENRIFYYIPQQFKAASKFKLDLLHVNGVEVVDFPYESSLDYYRLVLDNIEKG